MLHTTSEIDGLPIIPPYIRGELTQAHLQRIADNNFIRVPEVCRLLKRFVATKYPRLEQDFVKPTLANILRHPVEVVEKLRLTDYFVAPSNRASAKQVCPICLAEDMPAHLLLAEPAYGICHFHRVTHIHRCASCTRRLTWGSGDYYHCRCGFDLRLSPTICVDSDTCSLYLSCLRDQALDTVHDIPELQGHVNEAARLRSTVAYLMQDRGIQSDADAFQHEMNAAVQGNALQWLAIGMRVGNESAKLNDVVTGIEARHVWSPALPEWAISCSQRLVDSVSWEPLRLLASSAQSKAVEYLPGCDVSLVISENNGNNKEFLERLVGNEAGVSSFLRNELLFEIHSHKTSSGIAGQQRSERLNALVELTRNLRWIDNSRWDLQIPISTKDEILAFIGAGAFHPSIALPIEHWHVDQRDVAAVFQRIWQGQWPEVVTNSDDLYILMFYEVFKPNIKPSDWFCLPAVDIERRVMALLCGDTLSLSRWGQSVADLALPLGFCAFLSTEDCAIYCDPQKYQLDSIGLVCPTWQKAAAALVNACRRAQDHMRGLAAWPKLAAQVAEQYQLGDPWRESRTCARTKANSLIAKFQPHPYKTLEVALQSQPYRPNYHQTNSTHSNTAQAVKELRLTSPRSQT